MQLVHSVIKVTDIKVSRQWYSSLLFEDISQSGDGLCSWRSGVTIVSKEKWNESFSLLPDDQSPTCISLVFEVPSFDRFLHILSMRDDKASIIAGEGSYRGRRYIKLLDPDMNIVVVLENGFDYAYFSDGERNVVNNPGEIMGMESFQKKK